MPGQNASGEMRDFELLRRVAAGYHYVTKTIGSVISKLARDLSRMRV